MGLYLGKDKISALRTIEKTTASMKAYLEAGGKCRESDAVSFDGCWQASDWKNVTDCSYMFNNCQKLTSVPALNTSNATNMNYMFYYCSKLTSVPEMDTSNVTDMRNTFERCESLTSIPLLDTSKVTNMYSMFYYCSKLKSIPALDVSNATSLDYMFNYCPNLEAIHMHGMKVSFRIDHSTKFTREALVEILNNLATVTTSPILTIGLTNLAKLTDADKAIATGKGWKLE